MYFEKGEKLPRGLEGLFNKILTSISHVMGHENLISIVPQIRLMILVKVPHCENQFSLPHESEKPGFTF